MIRYLEHSDIPDARAVLDACYPHDLRDGSGVIFERSLRSSLSGAIHEWGTPKFVGKEIDGKIVGVSAYAWSNISERSWELCWGTVRPEFQGQGIGHEMLEFRLSEIRKNVELTPSIVLINSLPSSLFLNNGFEKIRPMADGKYLMIKEL